MHIVYRTIRALLVVAFLVLLAACSDSAIDVASGQPGDDDQPAEDIERDIDDGRSEPEPVAADDAPVSDVVRTESSLEIMSPRAALIDALIAGEGDTLLVRYTNGAEPCSLARVTTTETETTVQVLLETGLNPNAAAMSCIAQVFNYEIETQLTAPVGNRELIAVPAEAPPATEDPFEGAVFPTDQYIGLTRPEAEALGEVEQRVIRVARIDDEFFALTEDFSPTRVNIEIEAGVVVAATSG